MPDRILILNADPKKKSVKKYVLNTLLGEECQEIFISPEDYVHYTNPKTPLIIKALPNKNVAYTDRNTPLIIPPSYFAIIIHSPTLNKNPHVKFDPPGERETLFSHAKGLALGSINQSNERHTIFLNGDMSISVMRDRKLVGDGFSIPAKEFDKDHGNLITFDISYATLNFVRSDNNTIDYNKYESKWENRIFIGSSHNVIKGKKGKNIIEARNKASHNNLIGNKWNDELKVAGRASYNTLDGKERNDTLEAYGHASYNTLNGGEHSDTFRVYGHASHNTLNGGKYWDNLRVYGLASYNTLNGNEGIDTLHVYGGASYNILNGDGGRDNLSAYLIASHNTLNGGVGHDRMIASGKALRNTLNGDEGEDKLFACHDASYNNLNGGKDNDQLMVFNNAFNNILNGDEGNDYIEASGLAFDNTLIGGTGNDTILSLSGAPLLQGDDGNDFILNYAPDAHFIENLVITGGTDDDVLIGSGVFWKWPTEKGKTKAPSLSTWNFNGGAGNDVIIPYVPIHELKLVNINPGRVKPQSDNQFVIHLDRRGNKINPKRYNRLKTNEFMLERSNEILSMNYEISTGDGQDIVAFSNTSAQDTITKVKDFNPYEDKLAFDNENMAQAVSFKLAWLKKLSAVSLDFKHKGHLYKLNFNNNNLQNQIPTTLKTTTDSNGINVDYPDLGQNIEVSCDYLLYNAQALANKLSQTSDPMGFNRSLFDGIATKKTFSQTYTVNLDKDIYVRTKRKLDLIPRQNKKGFKIQLGDHLANAIASFRTRDLFADETLLNKDVKTSIYQNFRTDEAYYFKTAGDEIPSNVVAIVVVQENSNGLLFTTQSDDAIVPLPSTGKNIQTFEATNFFTKGHFTKIGNVQNPSVSMRLGLILRKDNQLTTTPLSDPIKIGIKK